MAKDNSSSGNILLLLFDKDSLIAEEKLLRMRQKLIRYFNCALRSTFQNHEECADETIFRVANKIHEGIEITNEIETDGIEKYFFKVAHYVKLEFWRRPSTVPIDDDSTLTGSDAENPLKTLIEKREQAKILFCLQKCRSEFNDSERALFDGYYITEPGEKPKEIREKLAVILGFSRPTLKKRAFRLRAKLEVCLKKCLDPAGTKLKKPHI